MTGIRQPVVRRLPFWVTGVQSQNIWKYGPKVDFDISHILEWLTQLLEGFDVKNVSRKNGLWTPLTTRPYKVPNGK